MTTPNRFKGPRIKNTSKMPVHMAEQIISAYYIEEEETYEEAMDRILEECEKSGLNFDHEFGKYLAEI